MVLFPTVLLKVYPATALDSIVALMMLLSLVLHGARSLIVILLELNVILIVGLRVKEMPCSDS